MALSVNPVDRGEVKASEGVRRLVPPHLSIRDKLQRPLQHGTPDLSVTDRYGST